MASGRKRGNKITSRIEALFVSSITNRSMPTPSPPAGGMPYRSARKKSVSILASWPEKMFARGALGSILSKLSIHGLMSMMMPLGRSSENDLWIWPRSEATMVVPLAVGRTTHCNPGECPGARRTCISGPTN